MKKYQLFLSYYTLIAIIVLFIWALFFSPRPYGYLLTLLAVPIGIYYWLLITSKSKMKEEDEKTKGRHYKSIFIVLVILFVSAFSMYIYSEMTSPRNSESRAIASVSESIDKLKLELKQENKSFYEDVNKELKTIKEELYNINYEGGTEGSEDSTVMGDNDSDVEVGSVTIVDSKNKTVDVYLEKDTTSKTVGEIKYGKEYTYITKDNKWYLILLGEEEGYVSSQLVKEVSGN